MIETFAAIALALAYYLHKPLPRFSLHKSQQKRIKPKSFSKPPIEKTREVSELLILSLSAGMTVPAAIGLVSCQSDSELAKALNQAFQNHMFGANLTDELNELFSRDQYWKLLIRLLQQSWEQGATILENLTELNEYLLELERATVLRKVKRAGVLSVLPLGLCFLPAFGLVAVLPLVASLFNF